MDDLPADPLDRSRLAMLENSGGPDLAAELVELFVTDVPPRILSIRAAVSAADAEALVRSAHSLKGSSATIGAEGMAEICRQIEGHARAGEVAPAALLLDPLDAEFARVERALQEWVAAL